MFAVELMYAKMVLPLLGGTPAVWNTCMLFFQAALLAGYAYAHWATSALRPRTQVLLHLALILPAVVLLPIAIPSGWTPPQQGNLVLWLLALMVITVGLPFFVISTTSPLLQLWFARAGHPASDDPYFLYTASNAGSLAGLVGYLVVVEPHLTLREQSVVIKWGYVLLVLFVYACAFMVLVAKNGRQPVTPRVDEASHGEPAVPARRTLRWLALAFVPSSLMLGVTTYLTTDMAAVPLLWAIPLTLYLLTFMLAFARRSLVPRTVLTRALPMLVLALTVVLAKSTLPMPWQPILHLATFFVVALVCHSELASIRPPVKHLTEYYLAVAFGGALGAVFNALIAPVVFEGVTEYPLALLLACVLCMPNREKAGRVAATPAFAYGDAVWPVGLGILAAGTLYVTYTINPGISAKMLSVILGVFALICFMLSDRPIRFTLAVGALLIVMAINPKAPVSTIHQERDFFGVLRVTSNITAQYHELYHGSTIHGVQSTSPEGWLEPRSYYTRTGPIGDVFRVLGMRGSRENVAVVGLGAGSLATYGRPGQNLTFYEISPAVARIARNDKYFTYMSDAERRGVHLSTIMGDGRLTLAKAPDGIYDLIVLDAFSSDSIPVHLLTEQAIRLYVNKLDSHGMIALHISNQYLDLEPVLAALASDLGMQARIRCDSLLPGSNRPERTYGSQWVVIAKDDTDMGRLVRSPKWRRLMQKPRMRPWTDDYSDVMHSIIWSD